MSRHFITVVQWISQHNGQHLLQIENGHLLIASNENTFNYVSYVYSSHKKLNPTHPFLGYTELIDPSTGIISLKYNPGDMDQDYYL